MFLQTETLDIVDAYLRRIDLLNKHMSLGLRSHSVAVGLKPFYRTYDSRDTVLGSFKMNDDEITKEFPMLSVKNKLSVYKTEIERLPSDTELIQGTTPITWRSVIEGAGLSSLEELNLALRTGIGALKPEYAREDLWIRIDEFCQQSKLLQPTEGYFDPISKKMIFEDLVFRKSSTLTVIDEFFESRQTIRAMDLDVLGFSNAIGFKDYYLVETDYSVIWSIGWDDFFFLIDGPKPILDDLISRGTIEGFFLSGG